jgi:hypothetical protein
MDLGKKIYIGIVEDNIDPKRLGRIKVRVQNYFDEIPLEHIPWSSPQLSSSGKMFDVPAIGKIVHVVFDDENIYQPYYLYSDNYNINLQDKLETLSDDEYTKFVSLLFDHRTRIYSETDNLTLDFLINKIKMSNDYINLELKDNTRKINLGSEDANQNAVLGQHFILDWFMEFMKILVKPTSLMGNIGTPVLKPELEAHINKFLSNPKKYVSKNVFIVDNDKVKKLERDSATSEVEHDDVSIISPKQSGPTNIENSIAVNDKSKNDIIQNQEKNKNQLIKSKPIDDTSISNINNLNNNSNINVSNNDTVKYNQIDNYRKNNNKPNKNSKFTIDKRGRNDVLNSSSTQSRSYNDTSKNYNPNYGSYNH